MDTILQVEQQLLGQMAQLKVLTQTPSIQPAAFAPAAETGGFASALEQAVRAVDARQHRASQLMAAVDSGQSDDLAGAMIESQKASVAFSALLQVRNKLASAFDDILRTPL